MFSREVISAAKNVQATAKPIDLQDIYVVLANLVFVHQVIVASEPLMEDALKVSDGKLHAYLTSHIEEERGHAAWLAVDLLTHGIDVAKIQKFRSAAAMAGSQYYLIKHQSPYALLGYMAVLEGFPVSIESVEALEGTHGKELFRTLRYHAEHDLDHRKDLFAFIDENPRPEIMQSAVETAKYMNELSEDLQSGVLWDLIKDAQ
jgi:hypothetical protein